MHHRTIPRFLAAVLLICGCGILDSPGIDDFPDAGPGGPDSLLAGVGRGVPFGLFGLPDQAFGVPYTGAHLMVNRSNIAAAMRAAQAAHTRLVVNLAGSSSHYTNADGTFNMALWRAQVDTYRDVDFAPYVTEGLILAHFLVDEPGAPDTWGGREISASEVEAMAEYSKSIWPSLPTAVRARPGWLQKAGLTWHSLDIAWAQWSGPFGGSAGRTPEEFRDENVAQAKAQGLGLVFGMNLLDGGEGSSGIAGHRSGHWEMSAAEVVRVGTVLAQTPYSCALLSWRYDAAFERRPGTRAALDSVAVAAADRGGISCLQRGQ
ncbi:MAG: hypothetical protein ACJ8DC_20175 [Gemmatimonadales bacterium]